MIRYLQLLALAIVVSLNPTAAAHEQTATQPTRRQRILKQFDKDGDGQLSSAERAAALKWAAARFSGNADSVKPQPITLQVSGIERELLVYLPTKPGDSGAPLVFGFHGHGGTAQSAARSFGFHRLWPEAIVVYMQGIPTPGALTDPDGKRFGWQHDAGVLGDRDLKFFDAVLKRLREKHTIDAARIYASGHSNGGGFTYLLWATHPDLFAAIAPSSASARSLWTAKVKPVPVMHVAGENDHLVKYEWQQRAMKRVRTINGCHEEGKEWAKLCTSYPSDQNAPFVALIHPGTHRYYQDAPALIVRFFKEHARADATR